MITFRSLEPQLPQSAGDVEKAEVAMWPLEAWYAAARDKPLVELSINDLAIACRQRVNIEHIVPLALSALANDPLAGELYDGELMLALKSLPSNYWPNHPEITAKFLALARRAYLATLNADLDISLPELSKRPIEADATPTAMIPHFGTSQTVEASQVFRLTALEMERLSDLLTTAVCERKEAAVYLGTILMRFVYGSNTGTAFFMHEQTLVFRSNNRDMLKLAHKMRAAYAHDGARQDVHLCPRYMVPNESLADIVFELR